MPFWPKSFCFQYFTERAIGWDWECIRGMRTVTPAPAAGQLFLFALLFGFHLGACFAWDQSTKLDNLGFPFKNK